MKIKEISLNNFSKYDQVTVSFDDNVTYLVGKNGSGKSTLGITGVQAIMQGIAEKASGGNQPVFGERFRFIGPKSASSINTITLSDEQRGGAEITVTRKITKSGSELSIVAPDDYGTLDQAWLNNLFNIFLIAPKKFCELTPKEQAKALGIDTKTYDDAIAELKKEYTAINAVYRSYGEIAEFEKVEKVEVKELQAYKDIIRARLNEQYKESQAQNTATRKAWEDSKKAVDEDIKHFNEKQRLLKENIDKMINYQVRIDSILSEMDGLPALVDTAKLALFIDNLEQPLPAKVASEHWPKEPTQLSLQDEGYVPAEGELVYIKELPDDADLKAIDLKIIEAGKTNEAALLYEQYLQKVKNKEAKEAELKENKDKQATKEQERIDYIKGFKFPFSNLSVGEDGELLLSGKPIKEPYFSTGEILKIIPVLISSTQPELKYVFLQDFNLLDDEKQAEIEQFLTAKGFQLVVEIVGKSKLADKNCILLRDNIIVENYSVTDQPALL